MSESKNGNVLMRRRIRIGALGSEPPCRPLPTKNAAMPLRENCAALVQTAKGNKLKLKPAFSRRQPERISECLQTNHAVGESVVLSQHTSLLPNPWRAGSPRIAPNQ